MSDPGSISDILWSADPTTQRAIWIVVVAGLLAIATVYGPLVLRAARLLRLERKLRELGEGTDGTTTSEEHDLLREAMLESPIRGSFEEFERRWTTSQLGENRERSPVRLMDVFEDRPLLPVGARRSLLPVLPGLFLGLGVLAAITGLIPSLASQVPGEPERSVLLASQLGLALRATLWGFLCAIGASLTGRLIEGSFNARSFGLDALVERAYGSVSPGELAEITRQTQQNSLDTLGRELSQFANELNERLDRGLQRIEQSTARSANLVSQEQRGALHTVVQELSLSVRQGVEHHLGELRGALARAIEHQTSVTGGLAETFERMVENSQTQDRVAQTLVASATAVEDAARVMSSSAGEMQPVLEHLGTTSRALADTADRIGETQQVVARTADGVRLSLEHAATGVDDQRKFIELSLGEIRQTLVGLGDGLGESLQRSLREVDDVLGATVGQLRATLAESNETIDRLAGPIRAAEGSTRETHVALDRVRNEVEALGQWMNQAVKPLRTGLVDVEGRAEEISRAITEFTSHTRQIDKTMEALRAEIHEESRRLQGAGSELGRRLSQASDAVGLLESTTSNVARRAHPEAPAAPRERSWSPAPSDPASEGKASRTPGGSHSLAGARGSKIPPRFGVPAAPGDAAGGSPPATPADDAARKGTNRGAGEGSESDSAGRDLALSGYRMGAPRAQGPDPYARFEGSETPPSNVRHFPTRDRELGDDLKLSGLLGPSGGEMPASDEPHANRDADRTDPHAAEEDKTEQGRADEDSADPRPSRGRSPNVASDESD